MDSVQNNTSLMNQAWQAIGAARNVQQQAAEAQAQPPVDRQGETPPGVEVQISDAARQAQARDAMGETTASTDLSRAQMRNVEQTADAVGAPAMPSPAAAPMAVSRPAAPQENADAAAQRPEAEQAAAAQVREHPAMQMFRSTAGLGQQASMVSPGVREIA